MFKWGDFTPREKVLLGLVAALLVAGALWRMLQPAAPAPERFTLDAASASGGSAAAVEEEAPLVIHIVGAVRQPGVYRLPPGSRVEDLVKAAGGAAADADLERVNLARPLFDGEQVIIYRIGEEPAPGGAPAKININRASVEELTTLPGIGPARAERIVAYREENGYFSDPSEIMDVSGIGESIYKSIADLITVY
ncbi:MAG: hypothetical protein GX044_10000 [Firmicutes bacterium]|jgi:competence protein ComEA|nr:hypothetical protein [Bacillota bacterium]